MRTRSDAGEPALHDHWQWRPEWRCDRPCLYWYLALGDEDPTAAWESVVAPLRRAPWLDVVPPRWWHVTLCDVGFVDELDAGAVPAVVDAVDRVLADARAEAPADADPQALRLTCGPVEPLCSAVAAPLGPSARLTSLQAEVAEATQTVVGEHRPLVHRGRFRPHLSLGYANREVAAAELAPVLAAVPHHTAQVEVDRLSLVAVTRRDRHYQWTVEHEVPLARRALTR